MEQEKFSIEVKNLSKTFDYYDENSDSIRENFYNIFKRKNRKQLKAISNLNFKIKKGEFLGIVGRNGSGKSTLLKLLIGAFEGDKGSKIISTGKIIRLALGMGFDPNLSARDNIYINGSVLGLSFREIGEIFHEIMDFSGLHKFVDTPVKHFSSGMKSRLTFSIAMHAQADIFLIDEFFGGVGDESFQKKSDEFFKTTFLSGKTIIHVSHSLPNLLKFSNRVLYLEKGEMKALGDPEEVIELYRESFREEFRASQNLNK